MTDICFPNRQSIKYLIIASGIGDVTLTWRVYLIVVSCRILVMDLLSTYKPAKKRAAHLLHLTACFALIISSTAIYIGEFVLLSRGNFRSAGAALPMFE